MSPEKSPEPICINESNAHQATELIAGLIAAAEAKMSSLIPRTRKPTSQKQVDANRRNAEKSTGPTSEEGKRTSSMNALRHGLTGCVSIMTGEDRAARDHFDAELQEAWQPANAMERELTLAVTEDAWRLKRARAVDQNIFSLAHPDMSEDPTREPDPDAHPEIVTADSQARAFLIDAKQLQLLTLYEQRIHRVMEKNITRLEKLQADRRAEHARAFEEALCLARFSHMEGRAYDVTTDFAADNGFVFSNDEIVLALRRADRLELAKFHQRTGWDRNRTHPYVRPEVIELPKAA